MVAGGTKAADLRQSWSKDVPTAFQPRGVSFVYPREVKEAPSPAAKNAK